jgi:nicotinate-nucleotide adenylyltransferase
MSSPPARAAAPVAAGGAGRHGTPASGPRWGILGGTFDPPHCGHLAAARACRKALGLDRLLLVVANRPWQKVPQRAITPAEDRWAMVEAAAAEAPGVEASRIELDRGGTTYTVDTVEALLARARAEGAPPPSLYLIVGSDLVEGLCTWARVEDLRRLVTLVVVSRPQTEHVAEPPGWRVVHVQGDPVDVSSSEVRDRLEHGLAVDGLVPASVIRCIRRRGLYAVGR